MDLEFREWFDKNENVNADDSAMIEAQLAALHVTGRWKQFRRCEVVCKRCGDTIAEVMGTSPTAVVVARALVTAGDHPHAKPSAMPDSAPASEIMAAAIEPLLVSKLHRPRLDAAARSWCRVTADADLDLPCRCRVANYDVREIIELAEGRRKLSV